MKVLVGLAVLLVAASTAVAKAGRYALTFRLNPAGEKILARLGAADRAYRRRHPHGFRTPTIAFGVSLSYAPSG